MTRTTKRTKGLGYVASTVAFCGAAYAAYAGMTWLRYGHVPLPDESEEDPLLDAFMPRYDVVDRLQRHVQAGAAATLEAAERQDLMSAPAIRAIFKLRQLVMGGPVEAERQPEPLMEQMKALGWVELARVPGREVVMGAVTQPWKSHVTFRSVAPGEFASFAEPNYVKIAWTLRADPLGPGASIFRTETRAIATDEAARSRFRTYWAFVSPGVWLIRRLSGPAMSRDAQRRQAAVPPDCGRREIPPAAE
jgi:hypothetical protein